VFENFHIKNAFFRLRTLGFESAGAYVKESEFYDLLVEKQKCAYYCDVNAGVGKTCTVKEHEGKAAM
jgi:hypothetical protein